MTTRAYGKLIQCGHTHYAGCDPCGCDEWVKVKPDTVTITMSREDAERFTEAYWDPDRECDCAGCQVVPVIRAALDGSC